MVEEGEEGGAKEGAIYAIGAPAVQKDNFVLSCSEWENVPKTATGLDISVGMA
jgi:hypothetical protein